ncbi:MAG: alanyl-tRNA editing protein [Halobacterium sp.]
MTDALYLDDSTETAFEATVDRVTGGRVVLDRTHFYPTGGGQPHDTGVLRADGDEWRVTDVQKNDTIYHVVDGDPPTEGTTVTGELDADRRCAHSRYHTAQHLLSAVLLDEFDAPTTGNQLYADRARLDCAHDRFTDTDLADVEAAVNDLVDAAHSVEWYTLDRETAEAELDPERTRLDLLPDSITEVRIVDVGDGDVDRTACAGTHVKNTSEVGEFEITGRETAGSGEERLRFVLH